MDIIDFSGEVLHSRELESMKECWRDGDQLVFVGDNGARVVGFTQEVDR